MSRPATGQRTRHGLGQSPLARPSPEGALRALRKPGHAAFGGPMPSLAMVRTLFALAEGSNCPYTHTGVAPTAPYGTTWWAYHASVRRPHGKEASPAHTAYPHGWTGVRETGAETDSMVASGPKGRRDVPKRTWWLQRAPFASFTRGPGRRNAEDTVSEKTCASSVAAN